MAFTREFVEAVTQGNLLRVRIMLKDSLLVDTSFNQFNEMIKYAGPKLSELWICDEEDDEVFSQSTDDLNYILVGLVNSFSKRRVNHLMGLINKKYPPKVIKKSSSKLNRDCKVEKNTESKVDLKPLQTDINKIEEIYSIIVSKRKIKASDLEAIRSSAESIIAYCDKISGK
jgi:hypothetical protein